MLAFQWGKVHLSRTGFIYENCSDKVKNGFVFGNGSRFKERLVAHFVKSAVS